MSAHEGIVKIWARLLINPKARRREVNEALNSFLGLGSIATRQMNKEKLLDEEKMTSRNAL